MVERFEAGKWYRWTGPKERQPCWNSQGRMDFILSGIPYLCVYGFRDSAHFAGVPSESRRSWNWSNGIEYFIEGYEPGEVL